MSQVWTITDSSGAVLCPAFATPGAATHPKDYGWAWASGQKAVQIAAVPDPSVQVWTGSGWTEDAALVEALLIEQLKAEAERRKMLVRSPGSGKGAEYRQKRNEALTSQNVLASTLNALTKPAALAQYPAAWTEAQLTKDPLATVLGRYLAASNAADAENFRLAAIEQAATTRIKAATAAATKRAAYAAINWSWTPS